MPSPIRIAARVHDDERRAVAVGIEMVTEAIGAASSPPIPVELHFEDPAAPARGAGDTRILITSMMTTLYGGPPNLDECDRYWSHHLADKGRTGTSVVLCNIFRHVPGRTEAADATALLAKIRALNLLAVLLSHRSDVHVADVDRVMSILGARNISSDYRLSGAMGADAAGYAIAQCLLRGTLDGMIDPAILEKAQHHWGSLNGLQMLLRRREAQRAAAGDGDGRG